MYDGGILCVAEDIRATQQANQTTLQTQNAKQNHYLTDHPRANAQKALQQLMTRAAKLRSAD